MTAKTLLFVSLGVNAVLAIVLVATRTAAPAPATEPAAEPVPVRNAPAAPSDRGVRIVTVPDANAAAFQWSQLESADFQKYMANLRAIGCPEETIRDLVVSDVNKLYAPRFAALGAKVSAGHFWKSTNKRAGVITEELRALQQERRELLLALLGEVPDDRVTLAAITPEQLIQEARFAFLSADKQKLAQEIFDKFTEKEKALRSNNEFGVSSSELKKVREERRQELASVLSPSELAEMDLRESNTAESVRSRWGSAEVTEDEYRKLFALRKTYEDEQGASPDYNDPEKMRRRSEAREKLEQAYRDTLGEQRFQEIVKSQDPSWRGLTQLAQQHNLAPATIDQAYQIKQQYGEQISKLHSDPQVGRDQRREALKQLGAEQDEKLTALLGQPAYEQYKKTTPQFYFSSGDSVFSFSSEGSGQTTIRSTTSLGAGTIIAPPNVEGRIFVTPTPQ